MSSTFAYTFTSVLAASRTTCRRLVMYRTGSGLQLAL
jgi:hypothetical protein